MYSRLPIEGTENIRNFPSKQNYGIKQPRPALGEIGNKFPKERENPKIKTISNDIKSAAKQPKIVPRKEVVPALKKDMNLVKRLNHPTSDQLHNEIKNVDENDHKDIFLLGRYVSDIYKYLLELEMKLPISQNYLMETTVTPSMRATLINWLVEIHTHYSLVLETLHLAVSIIDRFLQESGVILRSNFQLVGITSMFLACKFEENTFIEINEFLYMTDYAFSKQQVLDLEKIIIKKLDFRLGRPISLNFLRRYNKIVQADKFQYTLAKYFIELALLDVLLAEVPPSKVAAAATYIALCIKFKEVRPDIWTPTLHHYSTYQISDFHSVIKQLVLIIKGAPYSKYKEITQKYSKKDYMSVSIAKEIHPNSSIWKHF